MHYMIKKLTENCQVYIQLKKSFQIMEIQFPQQRNVAVFQILGLGVVAVDRFDGAVVKRITTTGIDAFDTFVALNGTCCCDVTRNQRHQPTNQQNGEQKIFARLRKHDVSRLNWIEEKDLNFGGKLANKHIPIPEILS